MINSSTWRSPTTQIPQIIQIFTRPHGSPSSSKRRRNDGKKDVGDILDRLKASAFSNKKNDHQDDYYYYDDDDYDSNEAPHREASKAKVKKTKTKTPAATTSPPKAAQYIPYFNRPYNRAKESGKMKNTFITRSYKQAPLSKYYKKR